MQLLFHHIGIATRSLEKCIQTFQDLGYEASVIKIEPSQKVKICFLNKTGSPVLEVIQPMEADSPISRLVKNNGTTPYHICYEVDDIQLAIAEMEEFNFRLLFTPLISEAMDTGLFCYLFSPNAGLIELYQREK
jgi:methylmalonyl-CoA/ethylmalonyl-CoA epimerase